MNTNTLNPEYAEIAETFLLAWDEGQYDKTPPAIFILELVERCQTIAKQTTPANEVRWLLETSDLNHPKVKRHFWTGDGWHWNALEAARYASKEIAKHVERQENLMPHLKVEICEHIFQCQPPQGE